MGLLAVVSSHVDLQGRALSEALPALDTLVGPLPGVSPHVALKAGAMTEALCAFVAAVGRLPGMRPHVDNQVVLLIEALRALVALVPLLVGGGPHADDHIGIAGNNLATQDTGPALAAGPMSSQLLKADQPHAAVPALGHAVVRGQ